MMHWELCFFFFAVAMIYSSVGFGGGSSYIALLSLYALPFKELRLLALICNVVVVSGSVLVYWKNGLIDFKKVLPIVLTSVPLAYIGAMLRISQTTFFVLLGCSLVVAALLLWVKKKQTEVISKNDKSVKNVTIGGAIGFLSGMVGIGGGIFLSPILNLSKWDTPKKVAATASFFILVNSIAGIAGQLTQLPNDVNYTRIMVLVLSVFLGGQIGARFGAIKFNPLVVKRVTAVVVFAAGINILLKHWPL
ncbi:MAG: sulfite exporter TauE/SafE family protein [Flavipsychrobacter sp.]